MKKIIFLLMLLTLGKIGAVETNFLCTDFVGKSKKIRACGPANLDLDLILKNISKKYGNGFGQLRIIGSDDQNDEVFLAASKKKLLDKICYFDLDKIFKYKLSTKSYELLWDTENQLGDVLDHVNSLTVIKHSMVRSAAEAHNCDPLLFINKVTKVGENTGSRYNLLLNPNNYILIPGIGHPTIYFFSSDLKKMLGSFLIAEPQHILMDAVISDEGTILSILRDMPNQVTCVAEYDLESGSIIRKKCAPKNIELTYLSRGKNPYVFIREYQKGEKLVSVNDWFSGEKKFYDFKPNAYYPIYFFPHLKIQQE